MKRDSNAKILRSMAPEDMTKEAAEALGLQPGRRIRWSRGTLTAEDIEEGSRRSRTGVVVDLYPYIFRVEWEDAKYKECFPYTLLLKSEGEHIKMLGGV